MAWVRVEDRAREHLKHRRAGTAAFALWNAGLGWCGEHLTDGLIDRDLVGDVWRPIGESFDLTSTIAKLLAVGLWHPHQGCESPDCPAHPDRWPTNAPAATYVVHDYFAYQPSAAEVIAKRDARSNAGRVGGIKSGSKRRSKIEANAEAIASPRGEPRSDPIRSDPDPIRSDPRSSSSAGGGLALSRDGELTRDTLASAISSWGWSVHGISPKWQPLAGRLEPFSLGEVDFARREAESKPGKPNAGLLLRIIERTRSEGVAQPADLAAPMRQPLTRKGEEIRRAMGSDIRMFSRRRADGGE